jgi:hypothetical protein
MVVVGALVIGRDYEREFAYFPPELCGKVGDGLTR